MKRYVKNFPVEPHLARNNADKNLILYLSERSIKHISGAEHKRLEKLIPNTDVGHKIYTLVFLLEPYTKKYKYFISQDNWEEIKATKAAINRVSKAMEKLYSFTLEYEQSRLTRMSICRTDNKRGIRSYPIPDLIFNDRIGLWPIPEDSIGLSLNGDFILTYTKGRAFNGIKKAIEIALLNNNIYKQLKVGDRNSISVWYRDKLNTLYLYILEHKEEIVPHNSTTLGYIFDLLQLPITEYPNMNRIIGKCWAGPISL